MYFLRWLLFFICLHKRTQRFNLQECWPFGRLHLKMTISIYIIYWDQHKQTQQIKLSYDLYLIGCVQHLTSRACLLLGKIFTWETNSWYDLSLIMSVASFFLWIFTVKYYLCCLEEQIRICFYCAIFKMKNRFIHFLFIDIYM